MSEIVCEDPASTVINSIIAAMRQVFGTGTDCEPVGGGSNTVRFFAGEGAPIDEVSCEAPFLWVRLASRYRSEEFPDPSEIVPPCGAPEVIVVEIGVARCAVMDTSPTTAQYDQEAEISLDDSWRIGKVMCLVSALLKSDHQVGSGMVTPYGPEGGIIAWSSDMYVSI